MMTMHPVNAAELPDDIKERAYPDGDIPSVVDMPELDTAMGTAKMRIRGKRSSLLAL